MLNTAFPEVINFQQQVHLKYENMLKLIFKQQLWSINVDIRVGDAH